MNPKTDSCCVCARDRGWRGFFARACVQCRLEQDDASSVEATESIVDVTEDRAASALPSNLASEIRALRRRRLAASRKNTSFKAAYDVLRNKRVSKIHRGGGKPTLFV